MPDKNKLIPLNTEECKKVSLDILVDVAEFCDTHDITYYLACGTLLGAVRHKGFIPWDDDVDIMMPRPDYNRFLNEYRNQKYELSKPSDGMFYYAKVYDKNTVKREKGVDYGRYKPIGIDLDVFPLDGIADDPQVINRLYRRSSFLETLLSLSRQPIFYRRNPLKAINRIIPRIVGSKNIIKLIEKNAQTYDYDSSNYVVRMRKSSNGFTGALPKSVYERDYGVFEGHRFCIPKGYDIWLKSFYGDYMALPPEEKRKRHSFEAYWK